MRDQDKTKKQLMDELTELRQQIAELKKSKAAQKQAKVAIDRFFDLSLVMLYIADMHTNTLVRVNSEVERITGRKRKELLSTPFIEFIHPDDRESTMKAMAQLAEGKPLIGYRNRHLTSDGDVRTFEWTVTPDSEHRLAYAMAFDITDRKRAEEALKKSQESYRELADSITDVFFAMDQDLKYTFWNRASERLTGIRAKEALGKYLLEVFPDTPWVRRAEKVYREVLKTQQTQTFVSEADIAGRHYIFEISAYPSQSGISVFVKDITERKRTEELIQTQFDLNEALSEVSELEEGLRLCFEAAVKVSGLDCGGVYLVDETSRSLNMAFHRGLSPDFVSKVSHYEAESDNTKLVLSGKPIYTEHLSLRTHLTKIEKREGLHAIAVIPIHHKNIVIGSLNIASHILDEVPNFSRKAIEAIAAQMGNAITSLRAEEALRESEEKYRILTESSPNGIFISDAERLIYVNQRLCEITGYSEHELLNMADPLGSLFAPEERERLLIYAQSRLKGEEVPTSYEARGIRKEGEGILLKLAVSSIVLSGRRMLQGSVEDITERKRAEEALRDSNELFEKTFNSQRDAIFILDARIPPKIMRCNSAAAKVFGYTPPEMIGRTTSFLHVDKKKLIKFQEYLYPTVKKLGFFYMPEYEMKHKDGTIFPTEHSVMPRDDEQGNRIGWVSVVKDITERKKAEEELKKHQRHLEILVKERTKKLEDANVELEMFAHSVSHDLRAPLRAMQGFTQALQEDYASKLDARGREYAERIVNASTHMDNMIQDLLAFSQLGKTDIKLKTVSMNQVMEEVMDQLEPEIKERNTQVKIKKPLPDVEGQRLILTLILSNILKNAITFVAPDVKPKVTLWAEERNGWIRLNVVDNGIGIDPEHHEIIFRIFERLHSIETYPGTGIGLAFVKRGMERMKGKVGVASEIGKGSQFWIELKKGKEKNGDKK
jgi:PAS domain S-box-containing protein